MSTCDPGQGERGAMETSLVAKNTKNCAATQSLDGVWPVLWRFSENVSDGHGIIGGICPARSLATDGTEIATSPILALGSI